MPSSKPLRALLASALIAVVSTVISGGFIFAQGPSGIYVFAVMPFTIALVAAWYVHAIDAMLISTALTAGAMLLLGWLLDCIGSLAWLLPDICVALVAGAILGVLVRAIGQHFRQPSALMDEWPGDGHIEQAEGADETEDEDQ
jgi:hypothetical protein